MLSKFLWNNWLNVSADSLAQGRSGGTQKREQGGSVSHHFNGPAAEVMGKILLILLRRWGLTSGATV